MAKGFKGHGSYSADRGDASAFKPDKSFLKSPRRASEGEVSNEPHDPGLEYSGGKGSGKPFDPNLKFSGGSGGAKGGE